MSRFFVTDDDRTIEARREGTDVVVFHYTTGLTHILEVNGVEPLFNGYMKESTLYIAIYHYYNNEAPISIGLIRVTEAGGEMINSVPTEENGVIMLQDGRDVTIGEEPPFCVGDSGEMYIVARYFDTVDGDQTLCVVDPEGYMYSVVDLSPNSSQVIAMSYRNGKVYLKTENNSAMTNLFVAGSVDGENSVVPIGVSEGGHTPFLYVDVGEAIYTFGDDNSLIRYREPYADRETITEPINADGYAMSESAFVVGRGAGTADVFDINR